MPLLLAFAISTAAVQTTDRTTIYGVGVNTCGEWLERHKNPYVEIASSGWLGGFVTGKISRPAGRDVPRLADMVVWMDNYCRAHPFERVADAAQALTQELNR